jgi:hypothetical protein
MTTLSTIHLPSAFRTAEEKASTIRDLHGQLATATGDDVASVTNRIAKARSIPTKSIPRSRKIE